MKQKKLYKFSREIIKKQKMEKSKAEQLESLNNLCHIQTNRYLLNNNKMQEDSLAIKPP